MRTDAEIKEKLIDVLDVPLERRAETMAMLDKLDKQVLGTRLIAHHSQRGMAAALFWALGYDFKDIVEQFVDPSVAALT